MGKKMVFDGYGLKRPTNGQKGGFWGFPGRPKKGLKRVFLGGFKKGSKKGLFRGSKKGSIFLPNNDGTRVGTPPF